MNNRVRWEALNALHNARAQKFWYASEEEALAVS